MFTIYSALLLTISALPQGTGSTDPFAAPTAPLDPRVDTGRVTNLEAPRTAEQVAQPLPVVHSIAADAAACGVDEGTWSAARKALDRGLDFLRKTQGRRGGWMEGDVAAATDQSKGSSAAPIAVTAMGAKAFTQAGFTRESSAELARAMEFIRLSTMRAGNFEPDASGSLGNYVASAVAMATAGLNDPADRLLLEESVAWMRRNQWDQTEGLESRADWFGGAGYGSRGRPDLSNTQMMLDALHDAGVSPDDPSVQRALAFVARAQNSKATNSATWAQAGAGDGGFVYTPANGGESFASEVAGEGRYGEIVPAGQPRSLRSYGSMTYAGYKSMLYAGLTRDDPRVKAAEAWLAQHWTFAENPGLGKQGRFYYLHAMARALQAGQRESITASDGVAHQWRPELIAALVAEQRADGSWANEADRWEESEPELVTAYALLALEECLKSPIGK